MQVILSGVQSAMIAMLATIARSRWGGIGGRRQLSRCVDGGSNGEPIHEIAAVDLIGIWTVLCSERGSVGEEEVQVKQFTKRYSTRRFKIE